MYNFTTTTIINGADQIKQHSETILAINRGPIFDKDKSTITATKAPYFAGEKAKATITTSAYSDTTITYRLYIDVRLEGSWNPFYANDMLFKDKPFYVEFVGGTSIAPTIAKIAEKFQIFTYGSELLKITGSGNSLTIEATNFNQRFHTCKVQKFVPYSSTNTMYPTDAVGEFKDIATITPNPVGKLDFGTPDHLQRDYFLPTDAHNRYTRLNKDDMNIMANGKYTQYIITMTTDRALRGTGVLGEKTTSVTHHVLWVESNFVSTFEGYLTTMSITPTQVPAA